MADKKYLDQEGLKIVVQKLEGYADNAAASASDGAFKYVGYADNALKFYAKNPIEEGDVPAFTIDLPAEQVLDQARTTFVQEFTWDADAYPGATDPGLDGKPVLVLAVKTVGDDEDTFTYSFLSMDKVVTLYKGGETETAKVTVDADNNILVDVKISAKDGNMLQIVEDENGNKALYASSPTADLSNKANKLVDPDAIDDTHPAVIKEGQILVDNGQGDLAGSGITVGDITQKLNDFENEYVKAEDIGTIPTTTDPETGAEVPVADNLVDYIDMKTKDTVSETFTPITPEEIEAMFGTD